MRIPQTNIPDPIASDEYGVTGFFSVVGDTIWFSTGVDTITCPDDTTQEMPIDVTVTYTDPPGIIVQNSITLQGFPGGYYYYFIIHTTSYTS